jgi:phosphate starvation-inducible protein PhoH
MDTDGTVGKDGTTVTFTTVSRRLSDDVKFLVESLGGKAVQKSRVTQYTHNGEKRAGKESHRLFISMPTDIIPFRLGRKVKRFKPRSKYRPTRYIRTIERAGEKPAQCIQVESADHLYLTNNFIVTHNTLCALACALQLVQDEGAYDRLIVSRPVQPLGKDIGFLPGDIHEKMAPWMGPIRDSLEYLTRRRKGTDMYSEMLELRMLEVEPLTYIRGRSMPNMVFLLDEAQDITRPEIKTIVSRMGENSKLVLIGDVLQVSNPYLDATNNGLSNVVERFKPYHFAAHITLTKGERSKLASVASQIL